MGILSTQKLRYLLIFSVAFMSKALVSAADPTYWQDIRPIFRRHCTGCHSQRKLDRVEVSAGLALDTPEAVMQGGMKPVVVPGKSSESVIVKLLHEEDDDLRMPKDALPLEEEQIRLIAKWIDTGAKAGQRPIQSVKKTTASKSRPARRLLDVSFPTVAVLPKPLLPKGVPPKSRLELIIRAGPLPAVTALDYSPDGRLLAAGAYGRVTIWNLETAQPEKSLVDVSGAANDVQFSPDGKLLAVAGGKPATMGEIRIYETVRWNLLKTIGGHEDVAFSVSFSPDGQQLVSAGFDQTVRTWDVATGNEGHTLGGHSDFVYGVAYSPNGEWFASCSKDRSVKIYDAKTGESRLTLSGMNQDVLTVAVSPNGKSLVSSGYDTPIYWWDAETGKRIRLQLGHGVSVTDLAFSNDGKILASASADKSIRLWDGANGRALKRIDVGVINYSVAVSPDGSTLASGSFDGQVRIWDTKTFIARGVLVALPGSTDDGYWAALTQQGYFHIHPDTRSAARLQVRGKALDQPEIWAALEKAELVQTALRGEALPTVRFSE